MDLPAKIEVPIPMETTAVYHFHRQVERMERDSESEPMTPEKYAQAGLLLVTSKRKPNGVERVFQEYLCEDAPLAKLRAQLIIERTDLAGPSAAARKTQKLGFAADEPFIVRSALQNTGPFAPTELRPSIPFWSVAHPMILPREDSEPPKAGRTWDGELKVAYGFADFGLEYTTTINAVTVEGTKITIALKKNEARIRGKNVLLSMKAKGQWMIERALLDGVPESSKGSFLLAFGNVRGVRGGPDKTVEIGRCRCEFRYERVPVSFDEKRVYPAAWEHRIKHPIVIPKPPQ